jgi:mono/diheme cytochrome c family protein
MKRVLKVTGVAASVIAIGILGILAYLFLLLPDAGSTPVLTVARTAEQVKRGRYLVHNVSACIDCHSTRDWSLFSGPVTPGTEGKGGQRFDESIGFPGTIYSRNITPAALGNASDGQILQAIAGGVDIHGKPLFPLMPYKAYANLSESDLHAIIAYLRTLKPIENSMPEGELDFPLNLIVRTMPGPYTPQPDPNRKSPYEYGKYLVNAAGCVECHTQAVKGKPVKGMEFAGGMSAPFPNGEARSANITPDEETGIGLWTKDIFVAKFKEWENTDSSKLSLERMGRQTFMPWTLYAGMTEEDLGVIYTYLRTLPPVKNSVETWTPLQVATGGTGEEKN